MLKPDIMKTKIILLFTIVIGYSTNVFAQYGYAGVNIGYGLGVPAYGLGSSTEVTSTGDTKNTLEKGSYGQGLNFGLTGGYMFNENIGAELGISFLMGSKQEFTASSFDFDTASSTITTNEGTITLDDIKMIRLNPAIKLTFGDEVRPYLRLGIILGLGTGYTRMEEMVTTVSGTFFNDTIISEMLSEYKGGAAFGFNSAFGVDFNLSDNLVLFGELSFSSVSWAATESKVTKLEIDGVDYIENADPDDLITKYEDEYTVSTSATGSQKALKTYRPFGNFGISAGLLFTFGK
jgi:hypothetical protein